MSAKGQAEGYSYVVPVDISGLRRYRNSAMDDNTLKTRWPWDFPCPPPQPLPKNPAFGKPDQLLAMFVCESIKRAMPATPWRWQKHRHIPTWIGWAIVIGSCLLVLCAAGR